MLFTLNAHAEGGSAKTGSSNKSSSSNGSSKSGRGRQLPTTSGRGRSWAQRRSDANVNNTVRNFRSMLGNGAKIEVSGRGTNRKVTGVSADGRKHMSSPFAGVATQPTLRPTSGRYRVKK